MFSYDSLTLALGEACWTEVSEETQVLCAGDADSREGDGNMAGGCNMVS